MENEKNIENFFRKRLEGGRNFNFNERDWSFMERKLDDAGLTSSSQIISLSTTKLVILVILSLSLAFFLGWFTSKKIDNKQKSEIPVENSSDSKINSNYSTQDQIIGETDNNISENKDPIRKSEAGTNTKDESVISGVSEIGTNTKDESVISGVSGSGTKTKDESVISGVSGSGTKTKDESGISAVSGSGIKTGNETNTIDPDESKEKLLIKDTKASQIIAVPDHTKIEPYERPVLQGLTNPPGNSGLTLFNLLSTYPERPGVTSKTSGFPVNSLLSEVNYQKKSTFLNRWLAALSIAPDFTGTGLINDKSLAARIGGHLYYRISPKWTISTGVMYSDKKYDTSADDYSPPENYWKLRTNGMIPENITGTCKVIDLPVMVDFRYYQKRNIALTISTGISSYFLLDEYYRFEFNAANPGSAYGWETEKNSMAPLSVINFATGLEFHRSQRSYISVEPFLKIPIDKVGWGDVNLYSMGIQLILKYQLKAN